MPREERGVLGVKKDSKKPMLFSFAVRQGEEWASDDSDDSDFCLTKEEEEDLKLDISRKKRSKRHVGSGAPKKQASFDSIRDVAEAEPPIQAHQQDQVAMVTDSGGVSERSTLQRQGSQTSSHDLWGDRMPMELLLKIFHFVAQADGALPFLCRAARTCSLWRDTSRNLQLWRKVDLSYEWIKASESLLQWLCLNRLERVQQVNMSSWKALTNKGLQDMAENCPLLERANFSYCKKIGTDGLKALISKCTKLKDLDLSFTSTEATSPVVLKYLIEQRGGILQSLNVSGNTLKAFNMTLTNMTSQCPLLDTLELSNVTSSCEVKFNIEKMQEGCPRLRCLRMANVNIRAPQITAKCRAAAPGFPCLEEVSLGITNAIYSVCPNNDFLNRLLKNATRLKLLDIRGSSGVNCQTLQSMAATDLQHLFVSQSSVAEYAGIEVIMTKWQHSLIELDLSWNLYPGMSLDCAMRKLAEDPSRSRLEILNLSGTSISSDRVQSLLSGCPNLCSLNLSSCRGLPRGMKKDYNPHDLQWLRDNIQRLIQEGGAE